MLNRARLALTLLASALVVFAAGLGLAGGQEATAVGAVAGAAALGIALAAAIVVVVTAPSPRALRVGARDHRHREALDRMAAPAHPNTAGRPRPRAPGGAVLAA